MRLKYWLFNGYFGIMSYPVFVNDTLRLFILTILGVNVCTLYLIVFYKYIGLLLGIQGFNDCYMLNANTFTFNKKPILALYLLACG